MAFTAKDGSKHTNHSTMKAADARYSAKQKPAAAAGGAGGAGMMGGGGSDPMGGGEGEADTMQPQDGAAMAQEHGPAETIAITHDDQAGKHTVHAEHPDGHQHDTEHGSREEAHQYAADCAGCGMGGQ